MRAPWPSPAYNYATEIGLVTFGSEVNVPCALTPFFEEFKDRIEAVTAEGDTRLFDALQTAAEQLSTFATKHPRTKLRVLALSDGRDTLSSVPAHSVCALLQRRGVTLDAVCVGNETSDALRAIAKATGGYCFQPERLRDALKLCELETLLTLFERPDAPRPAVVHSDAQLMGYARLARFPLDVCDDHTVPPRKQTASLSAPVLGLQAALDGVQPATVSSETRRAVLREMRELSRTPHSAVDVFPCESDFTFWRVLMGGPDGSSYAGGHWLLYVRFPDQYPVQPPEVRFVTPIIHCNINAYGKVCHSILDRNWSADTTMLQVFSCVFGLLLSPDRSDPLDSTLALQSYDDNGAYEASVIAHTAAHASRTREEWLRELTGAPPEVMEEAAAAAEEVEWEEETKQDGTIIRTPYVHGKKHGVEVTKCADGYEESTTYVDGKMHGVSKILWPDGTVDREVYAGGILQASSDGELADAADGGHA